MAFPLVFKGEEELPALVGLIAKAGLAFTIPAVPCTCSFIFPPPLIGFSLELGGDIFMLFCKPRV